MNEDHNMPYIYESPDGGKTVYRRVFGDYTNRELIEFEEDDMKDEKWEAIQEHCRKLSAEMLEWQREEYNRWGSPWASFAEDDHKMYHTDQDDMDESCVGC